MPEFLILITTILLFLLTVLIISGIFITVSEMPEDYSDNTEDELYENSDKTKGTKP